LCPLGDRDESLGAEYHRRSARCNEGFFSKIVDGGKDVPGNDPPSDLGELDFDLAKPRKIGGCETTWTWALIGQLGARMALSRLARDFSIRVSGLKTMVLGSSPEKEAAQDLVQRIR
jgi:hypothetical protein